MNAYSPQSFYGRLAELCPFEISVSEAAEGSPSRCSGPLRDTPAEKVSAAELYGCVDWYQYPGQAVDPDLRIPI
jgi:hypothetical protein